MNDWNLNLFLSVIIAVQAAQLFPQSSRINYNNAEFLLLIQIICFAYLTFVPGILLLRALKLHNLGSIQHSRIFDRAESGHYNVYRHSIEHVTAFGRHHRTDHPFSADHFTDDRRAGLVVICYLRDRDHVGDAKIEVDLGILPPALLLLLIPFMAIFGTYNMNRFSNNTVLVALILVLGCDRAADRIYPHHSEKTLPAGRFRYRGFTACSTPP